MNGRPVSCEAERKRKKKGVPRNREKTEEREWSGAGRADRFEVGVAVRAGVGARGSELESYSESYSESVAWVRLQRLHPRQFRCRRFYFMAKLFWQKNNSISAAVQITVASYRAKLPPNSRDSMVQLSRMEFHFAISIQAPTGG